MRTHKLSSIASTLALLGSLAAPVPTYAQADEGDDEEEETLPASFDDWQPRSRAIFVETLDGPRVQLVPTDFAALWHYAEQPAVKSITIVPAPCECGWLTPVALTFVGAGMAAAFGTGYLIAR